MIRTIFSTLPSFKKLEFKPGLNLLVAKKEAGASEKQTRNRAGKTSVIEIIHFLTGADIKKDSLFSSKSLRDSRFGMTFDLGSETVTVERPCNSKEKISVQPTLKKIIQSPLSNAAWIRALGEHIFQLNRFQSLKGPTPKFRSLFAYFARRQVSDAFSSPDKQAAMQQNGDSQLALLFLLGLDWTIASDWQKTREREKTLKELKKAADAGAFGSIFGKSSDLRTQWTLAADELLRMQSELSSFRVLPQYAQLQAEADQLTRRTNDLSNENVVETATIRELQTAMTTESPPPTTNLENIYKEAGILLPELALKRYEEVRKFHDSVIRNRRDYLTEELASAKRRFEARELEKTDLVNRRAEIMNLLKTHGALEQFTQLQAGISKKFVEVEQLKARFEATEQFESTKSELELERSHLSARLRRDFSERRAQLTEAILAFEDCSRRLYESAGSMTLEVTSNGPAFQFPMQGSRSKGIKNMQIFCFDMMLMKLCSKRSIGPRFLVHDSHLFDGVDGRQVLSALKAGAELSQELGFQYIVTMNDDDDAFKEQIDGFDLRDYVIPVDLRARSKINVWNFSAKRSGDKA